MDFLVGALVGLALLAFIVLAALAPWTAFVMSRHRAGRPMNGLVVLGGGTLVLALSVGLVLQSSEMPHSLASVVVPPAVILLESIAFLAIAARGLRWPAIVLAIVAIGAMCVGGVIGVWSMSTYSAFQQAEARCGHAPVIAVDAHEMGRWYLEPGDRDYDSTAGDAYYCSGSQAETAGYERVGG